MDYLSERQRLIYESEAAGSRLVELARFSGTEHLPMFTRGLVDVCENIIVSERYFAQARRYRALGIREESAKIAEERAQEYNKAAISAASNTRAFTADYLRPELEARGGSVDVELVDRLQESFREELAEVRLSAGRIKRFEHASRECFDVARNAGTPGLCDVLSTKVSEIEQLRQAPDRGMTHHSPAEVIALGAVALLIYAIIDAATCANTTVGCNPDTATSIFLRIAIGGIIIVLIILGGHEEEDEEEPEGGGVGGEL